MMVIKYTTEVLYFTFYIKLNIFSKLCVTANKHIKRVVKCVSASTKK